MITSEEVQHIARLARLELSSEEEKVMAWQMQQLLEYFSKIGALNTENVPPTIHAVAVANVLREDVPGAGLTATEALQNAPATNGRFFTVPKVLDKD